MLNVLFVMLQAEQSLQGELTKYEEENAKLCRQEHTIQKELEIALDKAAESQSQWKESQQQLTNQHREREALRQTLEQAVAARHSAHEVY